MSFLCPIKTHIMNKVISCLFLIIALASCLHKTSQDYFILGQDEFIAENYDGAIEDMTKAISLKSDFAKAYFERADAYYNIKDYSKALEDYSKAIEINPDYAIAYRFRGVAKLSTGDTSGSFSDWQIALKLGDSRASHYLHQYWRQQNQHH